ncbi:MAG: hypothetical protein DRO99_03525 [Candidatus Aenigmatarchaeota archaeon]|nr:MAG: hypothetical protein DRO99_03525 [Candidatus Aenigmarchaeota archaeon]
MLYTHKTFEYESGLKEADVALLGVPFSSTETGRSVKHGPLFIREAIRDIAGFDPKTGKNPFEGTKFCDLGNVSVVPGNWKLTEEAIRETLRDVFQENPEVFPVILGGEHLITLAAANAVAEQHGSLTIIDFDAHRDLMDDWMGEKHSHITWARRALENSKIRLVQIGCRSWNKDEWEPFKDRVKEAIEGVTGPAYITVDLDVLDPSVAPEVGTPEPEGMGQRELMGLLEKACRLDVKGMDIVECSSDSVGTQTALAAAHIFKKVMIWK